VVVCCKETAILSQHHFPPPATSTAIVTWAPLGNEIARGNIAELDSSSGYCVAVAATTSAGTGPYGTPATIQGNLMPQF